MKFKGIWHIHEMEMWEGDYFNEEVQAYVKIKSNGTGDFQFGYVRGQIDGEMFKDTSEERIIFSFLERKNLKGYCIICHQNCISL
jgi:hypothetical protein